MYDYGAITINNYKHKLSTNHKYVTQQKLHKFEATAIAMLLNRLKNYYCKISEIKIWYKNQNITKLHSDDIHVRF